MINKYESPFAIGARLHVDQIHLTPIVERPLDDRLHDTAFLLVVLLLGTDATQFQVNVDGFVGDVFVVFLQLVHHSISSQVAHCVSGVNRVEQFFDGDKKQSCVVADAAQSSAAYVVPPQTPHPDLGRKFCSGAAG